MLERLRILLVEDNPGDARLCRELLLEASPDDFEMVHVTTLAAGLAELTARRADVVLLDLSLPDASGLATVIAIHGRFPWLPIIVLSGLSDAAVSLEALQNGAQDYLVKGEGDGLLVARAIRYAIERKRVQLQLVEEKERAELASRAKSQFLANMSHELRTPLNAIIGFSEILMSEAAIAAERRADYARSVRDSGVHLLKIINDILDLSKIEAGKLELEEDMIDPRELVEACTRIIGERLAEAGLALVVTLGPDLPHLRADELKLKQILLNLLSNAVKFTPAGGEVRLNLAIEPGEWLLIEVKDTGIGIAESDIEKVLLPFMQVEGALNRRFQGTGLGLSLTRSLVELHGGELKLTSAPGAGTAVLVRLPPERLHRLATAAA
jgi:signal transduction histidine kinase